jgi:uncharacterized membrane protein
MSTLSVWAFADVDGAARGLRVLERLQTRGRLVISDSAVAERSETALRPVTYQTGVVDGDALLSGAFWGLLFSLLYLAPIAGLTGPAWPPDGLARIGLPEEMLSRIREQTTPGTSLLFLLSSESALEQVRSALASPEDDALRPLCVSSSMTTAQALALHRAFGAGEASGDAKGS